MGNITGVTVQDPAFPFSYDQTQFDLCLDIPVLKDNLNAICEKVDDNDFQKIILRKLNEAYPAGVSDENVQVLGSVSRTATVDDISKWNITTIDTLSALMKTEDGPWEAAKSRAVITRYLNTPGTSLGTSELNAIDSNLCALDTTTLKTITPESLRKIKSLNVASCSFEQKKVLYEISNTSFSSYRASPVSYYNLIKNFLGGAPLADIQTLSTQNINMDISTFQSLNTNVINKLTVSEVQGLLGNNVADLKTFEKAPAVEAWINLQRQSNLDTLGLGLATTRVDPTSPPPVMNSTATDTSSATPATNTSSTTPATNTSSTTPATNTSSTTPATNTSSTTPATNTSSTTPATNTSSTTPATNTSSTTPATNTSSTTPATNTSSTTPATNTSSTTPATNTSSTTPATNTSSTTPATNTSSTTPATNTSSTTPATNTSSTTPATSTSSNTPATSSSAASTPAPGSSATSHQMTTTTLNPATTTANNTVSRGEGFISQSSSLLMVLLLSVLQLHII
ncbi:uncharacterized protein LOC117390923 [Periophthalmus magnuspinnatus]|uniref:uncharacterized protein LOC117390923 n=1 Tax=Periophthalmus magnuspinnatus TaxID=409849 RepID=UPI0024369D67|nr:uncharacterized protein LOC117390923 [Periophthalmus magnuspinnatus]